MGTDQIAEEQRRGRIAGASAVAAAVLIATGSVLRLVIGADAPDGDAAGLRFYDSHTAELFASSVLRALGILLLVPAALHLYRAMKARNPKESPVVAVMAVYGPLAWAASTLVDAIAIATIVSDFTGRDFPSARAAENEAEDLLKDPSLIIAALLGLSGIIATAFFFVKGGMDAMKIGLLSRFMGVMAISLGPLLVLVNPYATLLLPVWLLALGALYLRRWPGGLPPAWVTGDAVPWPSRGDPATGTPAEGDDGSRNGEVDAIGPGVSGIPEAEGDPVTARGPGRRKRKRRR
jgi:hypothetical protein